MAFIETEAAIDLHQQLRDLQTRFRKMRVREAEVCRITPSKIEAIGVHLLPSSFLSAQVTFRPSVLAHASNHRFRAGVEHTTSTKAPRREATQGEPGSRRTSCHSSGIVSRGFSIFSVRTSLPTIPSRRHHCYHCNSILPVPSYHTNTSRVSSAYGLYEQPCISILLSAVRRRHVRGPTSPSCPLRPTSPGGIPLWRYTLPVRCMGGHSGDIQSSSALPSSSSPYTVFARDDGHEHSPQHCGRHPSQWLSACALHATQQRHPTLFTFVGSGDVEGCRDCTGAGGRPPAVNPAAAGCGVAGYDTGQDDCERDYQSGVVGAGTEGHVELGVAEFGETLVIDRFRFLLAGLVILTSLFPYCTHRLCKIL